MYVDFNINDSNTPSDYSWTLIKGADGTQGTPGKAGADGKTPYFHTAYAYSADGADRFTTVYPNLNLLDGTKDFKPRGAGNNTANQNAGEIHFTQNKKIGDLFKAGDYLTVSYDVEFLNTELYSSSNDVFMQIQLYGGNWLWLAQVKAKNMNGKFYTRETLKSPEYIENPARKVSVSRTIQLTQDFINANATVNRVHLLFHFIPVGANVIATNLKIEQGSIATPHMPSASEVTTADWPSYIGQYTDFTQADSTNPSAYTWSLIRGNDGKDGANGKDGIAGKDGVGIKTTVITYAISTSGTTAPTTGWTSSVPSLVKGQYLWTKTLWTYTDSSSETGYSVTYISKDGNNGHDGIAGKDGVGIKTTTITYAGSTSGTTAPTSGWTSTVPTVAAGSYLWTKTVWDYTDNTSETGYSVAKMGNNGATGPQGPQGNTGATGPQGPAGSNGDPGKVVSDTEPSTRFKGLTWKYSGTTDLTASDGTVIKPNTEYYYNGTHWIINLIEANQLNVNDLSAISGTFTNGKIENITKNGSVTSTILIEDKHILSTLTDTSQNTVNTLELDSQQGYSNAFVDSNSGRTRTVQANFQGFFTSDTDGPSAQLTPYGIYVTNGLQTTTVSLGSGINATLAKIGQMCQISINSNSSNVPAGNGVALSGNIPAGWRPAIGTPFEVMMYRETAFQRPLHITIGTDGKLSIVNASASSYWCFGGTVYMLA
ncbi:collagen-like protein [Lactococcus lactis]|nr:collagen-like protein [Lactococcus lactis]